MRKTIGMGLALWAGMAATTAQAADAAMPCLTVAEAQAMITAVLPDMIDGLATKCAAALPEPATLRAGLPGLMARYRPAADAAWPLAGPVIVKLAGKEMAGVDPKLFRTLMGPMMADMVSKDVKPADCPKVDRIIGAIAPLPPANLADLFVAVIELKDEKNKGPAICQAVPATPPSAPK